MLQQIREYATGWVAAIILGAIALSFVFFGIDFGAAGANVGLRVNGEKVPRIMVENAVRNSLRQVQERSPEALTPELEQFVRAQAVNTLVNQTLVQQEARERGFRVTDAMLAERIQSLPDFIVDGRFDRQLYLDTLAANNRPVKAFEAQVRESLQAQQVQDFFAQTAFVTTAEVRERVALLNETRIVDYLRLPLSLTLDGIEVSEEEIQARYENAADVYTRPETAQIQYVELRLEDVAQEIEVSEEDLRDAYEAGLENERFRNIEERRARHILVQTSDARSPEQAREVAADLLARIQGGESFAAVARAESDDTLSGPEGGDLGWVAEGTLDDALVDAVFDTAPGAVTGPVRTPFGWHLVTVDEIRGGDVTSFEDAREELLRQIRESRADGLFIDRGEQLAELVFQNAGSLEPAAEALDLELQTLAGVSRERGSSIAANADVRAAVFSDPVLEEGLNSDVIELEFGHLVALRVVDRTPAERRPLEEVRDSIVSVVRVQKAREAVAELGEELLARVEAGTPLARIAAELDVEISPQTDYALTRQSREVPTQLVEAVFAEAIAPPTAAAASGAAEAAATVAEDAVGAGAGTTAAEDGTNGGGEDASGDDGAMGPSPDLVAERDALAVGGVSLVVGDYVIYRITAVEQGTLSPQEGARLRAQLAQQRGLTELGAWLQALRAEADVFIARDYRPGEDVLGP